MSRPFCSTCGKSVNTITCEKCLSWWRENDPDHLSLMERIEQLTAENEALRASLAECKEGLQKRVVVYSGADKRGFIHVAQTVAMTREAAMHIIKALEALKEPKT